MATFAHTYGKLASVSQQLADVIRVSLARGGDPGRVSVCLKVLTGGIRSQMV